MANSDPNSDESSVETGAGRKRKLECYLPFQHVSQADEFNMKHTGLQLPAGGPDHVTRNKMLQRYNPRNVQRNINCPPPGTNSVMPGDAKVGFVAPKIMTCDDAKKRFEGTFQNKGNQSLLHPDGLEFTQVNSSEWVHLERTTGAVKHDKKGRMQGCLDKEARIVHFEKRVKKTEGRKELCKQVGVHAVAGCVGMAVHVAEHNAHKHDKVRGVRGAVGSADTSRQEDGSRAHADYCSGYALEHSGGHETQGYAAGVGFAGARAQSAGIPDAGDLFAPMAEASAGQAHAAAIQNHLGARAHVDISTARVAIGLHGTPLQAAAEGPGARAAVGFHLAHLGGYFGAHVAEASCGPFSARIGCKFGAGVESGIPVVHMGPVSAPCSIM